MKISKKFFVPLALAAMPMVAIPAISMSVNTTDSTKEIAPKVATPKALNISSNYGLGEHEGYGLNAGEIANIQRRSLSDSNMQPTGFFVKGGLPVTMRLAEANNEPNVFAHVGMLAKFADINNAIQGIVENFPLQGNVITFTPKFDGMLNLQNSSNKTVNLVAVEGQGVIRIPVFATVPTTNPDDQDFVKFKQSLETTTSPLIELWAHDTWATISTSEFKKILAASPTGLSDLSARMDYWDFTLKVFSDLYGISPDFKGTPAYRYPQRVQIIGTNLGGEGYYGVAGNGAINVFNNIDNPLTWPLTRQWLLWHEFGHHFQNRDYIWSGTSESTVDVNSLHMQEVLGLPLEQRFITDSQVYFSQPISERVFDGPKANDAIKAMMFYQLNTAFGTNFYPYLNQNYRMLTTPPQNSNEREQMFMIMASKTSKTNLLPFFEQWGLPIEAETRNTINALGLRTLVKPIWENWITDAKYVELSLPPFAITQSNNVSPISSIPFGRDMDARDINSYYTSDKQITRVSNDYLKMTKNGAFWSVPTRVYVKDEDKAENYYDMTSTIDPDSLTKTISLHGNTMRLQGYVSVDEAKHKINFFGTTQRFHSSWGDKLFGQIQILDEYGFIVKNIDVMPLDNFANIIKTNGLTDGFTYKAGYKLRFLWDDATRNKLYDRTKNDFVSITKKDTIINL